MQNKECQAFSFRQQSRLVGLQLSDYAEKSSMDPISLRFGHANPNKHCCLVGELEVGYEQNGEG